MFMLVPMALSFFACPPKPQELSPEMQARAAALRKLKESIQDWRTFYLHGYDYREERILAGHDIMLRLAELQKLEPLARLSFYVTNEEMVLMLIDTTASRDGTAH